MICGWRRNLIKKSRKKKKMNNTYYQRIVVKIEVEEGADIQEVVSECDYNFNHDKIVETEIIEVLDE